MDLVIVGLIVAVVGMFVSYSLRDHIHQEIEEHLEEDTALVATYIAVANPSEPADDLADRLSAMLDSRVTLIAPDGRVMGDSDVDEPELQSIENHSSRPEVQDALQFGIGSSIRWSSTVRIEFLYVARKADPYIVRLAKPLSLSEVLISDLRSRLLVAMLAAVALTLGAGFVVRAWITRPLRQISAISKKLAAGDLNQRLPISGDDEIVALGNSLNTMAKNLSDQMRELSEGKQRIELIVGAMSEGVIVLDSDGQITLTNRAVRSVMENDRDPIGKTMLEVFRKPELENAVRNALAGGSTEVVEMTTGNARIVQANVAPVADANGVVDAVVVVFHDLTEIRRVERMRRDFVANVSHEFKTPLTSIRGYAETLLSGALQDRKIAGDFVKIIERNAHYLESLVSDLLVLARLEAELPASLDVVDVKFVVEETVSSRHSAIAERGITIHNECPSVEIRADRVRLGTAISNLIDNAIYYNKPNGDIRITGTVNGSMFELSIADSGQGIPAEDIPRIFERFYRVDKARSRESGGTGLGLSIVKHAIESQGGYITVASRIGLGSTFTIRLPISNGMA
jgi:two-component system phosphate regulon sensor histidine kinase PhoR